MSTSGYNLIDWKTTLHSTILELSWAQEQPPDPVHHQLEAIEKAHMQWAFYHIGV